MHFDPTINAGNLLVMGAWIIAFAVIWARQDMRIKWLEKVASDQAEWNKKADAELRSLEISVSTHLKVSENID